LIQICFLAIATAASGLARDRSAPDGTSIRGANFWWC